MGIARTTPYQHAERAVQLDEDLAFAWYVRGATHSVAGRVGRAIADWRRAMEIDPDTQHLRGDLSYTLAARGELAESLGIAIDLVRSNPMSANDRYHVGLPLVWLGEHERARSWFEKNDSRSPERPRLSSRSLLSLAILSVLEDDVDDAKQAVERLMTRFTRDWPFGERALGSLLATLGDDRAAADVLAHYYALTPAAVVPPTLRTLRTELGQVLYRSGNKIRAVDLFDEAVSGSKSADRSR